MKIETIILISVLTVSACADTIPRVVLSGRVNYNAIAPFEYYATYFDGSNDWLYRGTPSGVTEVATGTISFWMKLDSGSGDTTVYSFVGNTSARFAVQRNANARLRVLGTDTSGTTVLDIYSSTNSLLKAAGWRHVIASWDLGTAGRRYIYIDGTQDISETTFTTGTVVDYVQTTWGIGGSSTGSQKFFGDLCEFWFSTNWIDISQSTNLLKFRTSGGKPADLGENGETPTGSQPAIYLANPYFGFHTNSGAGGNFTTNGILTESSSEP